MTVMRTSIVLRHLFYCSTAYSEGGIIFLDFSAYVIRGRVRVSVSGYGY